MVNVISNEVRNLSKKGLIVTGSFDSPSLAQDDSEIKVLSLSFYHTRVALTTLSSLGENRIRMTPFAVREREGMDCRGIFIT